ncbi:helix-turn-helix transcriptional regulator [Rhizobium grahamii]|uniref:Putative AraC family transcriptional regulator n=1 Tax=Rhizobium grahamii CCGE 502 TaxID=990285 RepID=S3I1S2_9HYPH|nr:helix-turn-helix transcriptional regulator [Rhizobium grahamii]EPE93748.1 putative AraC family transcriptional regulator [Rhizobium grahamii CCGE 502]
MPQEIRPSTFKYFGSSFDGMIDKLSGAFGKFEGELIDRAEDFHWSLDYSSSDWASVITGYHQHEFQFKIEPTESSVEYLSIVLPRSGGMGFSHGSTKADAGRDRLLLYNTLEPEQVRMYGQSNVIDELLIDWNIIQQTLDQTFERPIGESLALVPELEKTTAGGQMIAALAETAIRSLRDPSIHSPVALAHITQALADLIIRAVPHRLSQFLERKPCMIAPWHIRRAIEFMEANVSRPIRMPMVAEAAGVSTRALQLGFRAFRETTPAAYLSMLRLRGARLDLLDPENANTTKQICLKWGFFHFGRFSAIYRSTYGECPSATRKRVRGAPVYCP